MKQSPWIKKDQEIAQLKAQIEELRQRPEREKFWKEVGKLLGLSMVLTPKGQWPQMVEQAFQEAVRRLPVQGFFETERLKEREQFHAES